jgi:ribosomal protein L22
MAEDYKVHDGKKPEKVEETKAVEATAKPAETKVEKKTEKSSKKTEAVVNGMNLSMGLKHAMAICNMIRNKDIDDSIKILEEVEKYKRAVPMRGEIPHRHGMMSGRYPIKATGIMVKLLKSLKSNAMQNELELEKFKIFAMANNASRPYRRFGQGRFKRTHVTIKLIPRHKENKKENKK